MAQKYRMIIRSVRPESRLTKIGNERAAEAGQSFRPRRIVETRRPPCSNRSRRSVCPAAVTPNLANAHERNLVRCKPNGHRQPQSKENQTPKHSHNLPSESPQEQGLRATLPNLKLPLNSFGIL